MNVLVTGGAGFIGSATVRILLAAGHTVTVLDDLTTGLRADVPEAATMIVGDIRDAATAASACQGQDAVIHLAAFVSVPASFDESERCHAINNAGTRTMTEAARAAGVKRFVLASTAAVYGVSPVLPTREDAVKDPQSPYADSKLAAEGIVAEARMLGLEGVVLRFFNVYGPRQKPDSAYAGVVSKAMQRLVAKLPFTIFGDGNQTRDFVYVDDVARACLAACLTQAADGHTINVGRGLEASVLDLVAAVGRVVGTTPELRQEAPRQGDARRSVADVAALREVLGLVSKTELDEGLAALHAWAEAQAVPVA